MTVKVWMVHGDKHDGWDVVPIGHNGKTNLDEVEVVLRSDYDKLRDLLKAVQSDRGNWLHSDLSAKIIEAVGEEPPWRDLDDAGV